MPGTNLYGGAVPNSYRHSRKIADEVDALLERATTLESSNTALVVRVALLEAEKATLELRLAALERWAAQLTKL